MSNIPTLVFPDLIEMNQFGGNFENYFHAVYQIFKNHFIDNSPKFVGVPVYTKKFPLTDGKFHRTFYHITHEGEDEDDRTPDLRRMERVRFPKFMINEHPHNELLVWVEKRKKEQRIHIFNNDEGYLLVLAKRKGFLLLWTAFVLEYPHQKRKKIEKYEEYIKAKTA